MGKSKVTCGVYLKRLKKKTPSAHVEVIRPSFLLESKGFLGHIWDTAYKMTSVRCIR